jgi:preprotein translocase subunit YajC
MQTGRYDDVETLILLVLSAGLLFLLFSRTRRQQREAATVQSRLEPGAEVMTGGGLFATVVELDEGAVVLETAPGQRSRWDPRAVARIISPAPADQDEGEQEQTASENDDENEDEAAPADPPSAPDRD